MKREMELFKICFNISMENILPEEKSLKTVIYAAFHNTRKFRQFLLKVRISKRTNQGLTSHLTPASRGW